MSDFVKVGMVILLIMGLCILAMDGTAGSLAATGW